MTKERNKIMIEETLLEIPIDNLKEAKDFAATMQDVEAFKLLRSVIMVKEVMTNAN